MLWRSLDYALLVLLGILLVVLCLFFFKISFTIFPTRITVHLRKYISENLKSINHLPSPISIKVFSKIPLASGGELRKEFICSFKRVPLDIYIFFANRRKICRKYSRSRKSRIRNITRLKCFLKILLFNKSTVIEQIYC